MKHQSLVLISFLLAASPTGADTRPEGVAACKRSPDAGCLGDIGLELAMGLTEAPGPLWVGELLMQMGRIDEAHALEVHVQRLAGASDDRARSFADWRASGYRLGEALRAGESLETAAARLQVSETMVLTTLARMAGMMTSGIVLGPEPVQDPATRAILRDIVLQLVGTELDAITAAGILLYIGEDTAARDILETHTPGPQPTNLPRDMVKVIGTDRALELYQAMDGVWPFYYASLVEIETDPDRQRRFLALMRQTAEGMDTPRRRIGGLSNLVRSAMDAGFPDVAEDAVARMRRAIDETPDGFRTHGLMLVRSLQAIGAQEDEVRRLLTRLEADLDGFDWGSQRQQIALSYANVRAALGDVAAALEMMDETEGRGRDWAALFRMPISPDTRESLMRAASERLSPDEHALFRAEIARSLALSTRSDAENNRAREIVLDLLGDPDQPEPPLLGTYYGYLLNTAVRLKDRSLLDRTLKQATDAALASGDFRAILRVAFFHHRLDGYRLD